MLKSKKMAQKIYKTAISSCQSKAEICGPLLGILGVQSIILQCCSSRDLDVEVTVKQTDINTIEAVAQCVCHPL